MIRVLASTAALVLASALASAQVSCEQGCTPGYWKTHPQSWDGIAPDFTQTIQATQSFNAVLGVSKGQSGLADAVTLIDAANLGGGGINALSRHTAAGLASADALACYAHTVDEVIAIYRDGIGVDPGPLDVRSAKDLLDSSNNAGDCPLPTQVYRYCIGEPGSCPCDNSSLLGGCANSTGSGTSLDVVAGGSSVADDDLVLQATGIPANAFSILIAAEGDQVLPFLDGNLCVGGNQTKIVRYNQPIAAPASGTLTWGPGLVALSQSNTLGLPAIVGIDPGESWFWQVYYRDPQGPCGNSANTSNALAITFN